MVPVAQMPSFGRHNTLSVLIERLLLFGIKSLCFVHGRAAGGWIGLGQEQANGQTSPSIRNSLP